MFISASSFALLSLSPTTFLFLVFFWTFLLPNGGEGVGDNDVDEEDDKQTGSFWPVGRLSARIGLSSKVGVPTKGCISSNVGVSPLNCVLCSEAGISSNGRFSSKLELASKRGFPNKGPRLSTTEISKLELCVDANGASISFLASSPKFFDFLSLAHCSCISFGARFFSLRGLRDRDRWWMVFLLLELSCRREL